MTFRWLLIVKSVVSVFFGLILLGVPGFLLKLMGTELGSGGVYMAREYGAALMGIFLLTWLAKNITATDARKAILIQVLVYDAIGMIVTSHVVLTGVLNALGWGIVGVYLFFTAASGYLLGKE
jgi:hypothetical protein